MVESKIILVLNEKVSSNGKNKTSLHIIQWGKNDPVIEKRNYYLKDDEFKTGKTAGFNKEDMSIIKDNWKKISKLL